MPRTAPSAAALGRGARPPRPDAPSTARDRAGQRMWSSAPLAAVRPGRRTGRLLYGAGATGALPRA
ncbi:hypothetical protein [Streptomyces sp. NPDC017529]|uniref:hypothetical protein n=1 Tax=Streptomyces sp. NPDC017529 TaxID=3365000 RepID=UPI0037AD122E